MILMTSGRDIPSDITEVGYPAETDYRRDMRLSKARSTNDATSSAVVIFLSHLL
jgi:hypothetical protein